MKHLSPKLSIVLPKVPIYHHQDKISTHKNIKTPPKTSATKSVHDLESHERRSLDGSMSPYNQNRDTRGLAGKRAEQFERNIRKFMESTDTDRDLEEKVRRRLIEISIFLSK